MKKVTAFIVALMLFFGTVYGLHTYSSKAATLDNNAFSTWSNTAKFGSPNMIKENINKNTLVVFGSSEFQHGQRSIYHPKAVFKDFAFNPMLIGAGYYQSLEHAITLASIGEGIQNKKAVILISPTWFRKDGVVDTAFASRFSESAYLGMLRNEKLSPETKAYMEERAVKLLNADEKMLEHVNLYNRIYSGDQISFSENLTYQFYEKFLSEKERQSVMLQAQLADIKPNQNTGNSDKPVDWNEYMSKAELQGENGKQNPFYMEPIGFAKVQYKIKVLQPRAPSAKDCYAVSAEYGDFRCFLDICKEMGIQPMVVALPVNGYWYDYMGLPAETRTKYYSKVKTIAGEYGADFVDLSKEEFTKYFFEDNVHLAGKGWVSVNEAIYNFYNEDKKQ